MDCEILVSFISRYKGEASRFGCAANETVVQRHHRLLELLTCGGQTENPRIQLLRIGQCAFPRAASLEKCIGDLALIPETLLTKARLPSRLHLGRVIQPQPVDVETSKRRDRSVVAALSEKRKFDGISHPLIPFIVRVQVVL
jgi:hypothetical protein